MRDNPRMWALISVLLLIAAGISWKIAERQERQKLKQQPTTNTNVISTAKVDRVSTNLQQNVSASKSITAKPTIPIRLTNSDKNVTELVKLPNVLLLQNAIIDTSNNKPLPIPSILQTSTNSHSFIVQARGALNDTIRNGLKMAKAKIVSYIPNNAYLVRAESSDPLLLARIPGVQAVVSYEPYFKLSGELIDLVNANMQNRNSLTINVLGYDGQKEELKNELKQIGANFIAEQNNPFGPQFTVEIGANILVDVALSDFVQIVEKARTRATSNDRSRVMVGVSLNLTNDANPLGLTGKDVLVNINDSGVDAGHPDLAGRVTALTPALLTDPAGHGTHIAGTIAGNGLMSSTVTGASGSPSNSNFRGMAPEATLYVQGASAVTGPPATDEELQDGAARSKARISNNSWNYIGDYTYSLAAASYDIAVRDSIPTEPGMQELVYVFSAGNNGSGDPFGGGGTPNTVLAPATAKNVITVGSTESARHITNQVVIGDQTNTPFVSMTDSDRQVAAFSSRGNVGYGMEGIYGRFKPDIVAPGTLLVSCRSEQYQDPTNSASSYGSYIRNIYVQPVGTNKHFVYVPEGASGLIIQIIPNQSSPDPFPSLAIEADQGEDATSFRGNNRVTIQQPEAGDWAVDVINGSQMTVGYDLRIIIVLEDENVALIEVVSNLNSQLGSYYRYESGTSMSAGVVSGVLALLEEFYTQRGHTNSPALMKALLINSARNLGPNYDYATKNYVNQQGWGLINLTNAARASMAAGGEASWTIQLFDQDPTNAIVTGQTHTRTVTATPSTNGESVLRITLVWTDPPGNPAAGIKLVNDLDLVVTNLDTGEFYTGNNFQQQDLFTVPYNLTTNITNATIEFDYVNNVENVFINLKTNSANYSVSVVGRRVNVNAVTSHPDGIAQDYALVISVGEGSGLSVNPAPQSLPQITSDPTPFVKSLTNGVAMIKERVGANSPLIVYTNGMTNQWNFYVFTNNPVITTMMIGTNSTSVTNSVGSNIMFVTFIPPNLSRSRAKEADIDLYVSMNPGLTNLNENVIRYETFKSLKRVGTEAVLVSNAVVGAGQMYYVGVKSEDQQAAEFGLYVNSSDNPFYNVDEEGNYILTMSSAIPDGTSDQPGAGFGFAVLPQPAIIRRLVVTNIVEHENPGDVLVNLSHNDNYVVLNNHSFESQLPPPSPLTLQWIYEDNDEGDIDGSQHPDGPGALRDFVGSDAVGAWQLTAIDSAWFHTGIVQSLTIRIEPSNTNDNVYINQLVQPGHFRYYYVNAPVCATNMHIIVGNNTLPLIVYLQRGDFPTTNTYDLFAMIPPNGGELGLSMYDSPPLTPGRYMIGVFNPDLYTAVHFNLNINFDFDPQCNTKLNDYASFNSMTTFDDATTNSTIFVPVSREISEVQVGVIVEHPRTADLVFHLISPQGTRVLLAENRGGPTNANYGVGQFTTNVIPRASTGGPAEDINNIGAATNMGFVRVDYDFYTIPDSLRIYYDGALLYDSGLVSGSNSVLVSFGPGLSTNIAIVVNQGNNSEGRTLWEYVATVLSGQMVYATFTENTNFAKVPIKFAPPPFTKTNFTTMEESFLSGFENNIITPAPTNFWVDYDTGSTVDGWEVATNQVAVVSDAGVSVSGSNFLALANGIIQRTLPTVGGHIYRLIYCTRDPGIVSWYNGLAYTNGQVEDVYGVNPGSLLFGASVSTNGQVGETFNFRGGTNMDRILIPDNPSLAFTNSFTIEGWINILTNDGGVIFFRGDNRPGLDPYVIGTDGANGIYFKITDISDNSYTISAPISNGWHHFAAVLCDSDSSMRLFIDGAQMTMGYTAIRPFDLLEVFSQPGVAIGNVAGTVNNMPFNGMIDEIAIYNRALSGSEIQSIYTTGLAGNGRCSGFICMPSTSISIDGQIATNHVMYGGQRWTTNFLTFMATNDNSVIEIAGSPIGFLFDSFYLFDISDSVYYLPEETLDVLKAQNSFGLWRLEVWDNRVGQVLTNGHLISWRLQLGFVNTNYGIITLTNHQPYSGTLISNQVQYFAVSVPLNVTNLTNTIQANYPITIVYNQTELPLPGRPGNVTILDGITNGIFVLSSNSIPALLQGQQYYLGIVSSAPTNNFIIQIDYDVPTALPLLPNGTVVTQQFPPGNGLISYALDVPIDAVSVSIEMFNIYGISEISVGYIEPASGAVELVRSSYNSGSADKQIILTADSVPFGLKGGRWIIGVKNTGGGALGYQLRAFVNTNLIENGLMKLPDFVNPPSFIKSVGTVLQFNTDIGRNYNILVSDDLVNWSVLQTITATTVVTTVVDMTPPQNNNRRFYRIVPSQN